jgi:hypothetical protein
MRIGLVPLDERPVNLRYPAMIAAIFGLDLVVPPPDAIGVRRAPGRHDRLAAWLGDIGPGLDALIVSVEQLAYGGLVPSRTTGDPAAAAAARLDPLRRLGGRRRPLLYGFNLITRISDSTDDVEEMPYWRSFGPRLYRLSQLLDRSALGQPVATELATLRAELPAAETRDWLLRRARNHTVNLAALQLVADGTLDLLVLSSDDTSAFGLPSREKRALTEWADRLELADRLLMYPGADEVGCALLARAQATLSGTTPRFSPFYAVPGGEDVIAPFEDGPVRVTVERQLRAVAGTVVAAEEEDAIWLAVDPPVPRRGEWEATHAARERIERLPFLETLVAAAGRRRAAGRPVAIADVAYPNGADPVLIELLVGWDGLAGLAAYGAWNTAGNTIGTVLAQACAAATAATAEQRAAQERFLLHRFVEDWGYQRVVRPRLRARLASETGNAEPAASALPEVATWVEAQLDESIAALAAFRGRFRIAPGSVRLPWRRIFEVDFDLEPVVGGSGPGRPVDGPSTDAATALRRSPPAGGGTALRPAPAPRSAAGSLPCPAPARRTSSTRSAGGRSTPRPAETRSRG